MTTNPDIAERVGPDLFRLRGKLVTGEELAEDAERIWRRDYEVAELLDRELGEPLAGLDVHKKALEILAGYGKADTYTDAEYIDACQKAGAR
jgi:hypothetical protein